AAMTNVALTCIGVAAQLVVIVSSDSSLLWLANLSAICNLIIVGVSASRMIFDVRDVFVAIHRRCRMLRFGLPFSSSGGHRGERNKTVGDEPNKDGGLPLDEVLLQEVVATELSDSSEGDDRHSMFDGNFWDASGKAHGTEHAGDEEDNVLVTFDLQDPYMTFRPQANIGDELALW
ncbi:membrane-associated protein, putative, partial [Bodo saltans]